MMTLVRIVKNYAWSRLLLQTPNGVGRWGSVTFTEDPVDSCDYVVILNKPTTPFTVTVPSQNIWAIIQEPPIGHNKILHQGFAGVKRIYTQDSSLQGRHFIYSQPVLPWHILKSYDELTSQLIPEKKHLLSWITSDKSSLPGHKLRLAFLEKAQREIEFHLYGRGFQYIEDKWDGLAGYKYSLAVENFQNRYYWSEKIADCFLAWTMPIYFGCTHIDEYFPSRSFIRIDISNPSRAIEVLKEVINSNLWEMNLDAIAEARRRVLDEYQLFPFLAKEIENDISSDKSADMIAEPIQIDGKLHWLDRVLYVNIPNVKNLLTTVGKRLVRFDNVITV